MVYFRVQHENTTVVIALDNSFTQRQAQSPTARFGSETGFEDTFEITFGHSFTGVLDIDVNPIVVRREFYVDRTHSRECIEGVFEQVFNYPFEQRFIDQCLELRHRQSVVVDRYVARYARAEIEYAASDDFVNDAFA